jgi:hypothetical protein
MMFEPFIGKSVRINMNTPLPTHFSKGAMTVFGHMQAEIGDMVMVELGTVEDDKVYNQQVHLIQKPFIKSIEKEWIESINRGNKHWYKRTDDWIPARDE